ncbi:MAG: hypothetical protein V3U20_05960 [Thermoplasmata archaeon]
MRRKVVHGLLSIPPIEFRDDACYNAVDVNFTDLNSIDLERIGWEEGV